MKTKQTTYLKSDFKNVMIPQWQRWRNDKNVKDLEIAVAENGQLRDVLICKTKDGTKILTDGAHLCAAMLSGLKRKKIRVLEKLVDNEEEARKTFISFNTRGKTLKNIDYIVSYAGSGNIEYIKFIREVLKSPNNENEAKNVHGKLFTLPALIQIFMGGSNLVRSGKGKMPKNFKRVLSLVEYLGTHYLFNGKITQHLSKNGKAMRLNGGSIIPVINQIKNNDELLALTNREILDLLINFTFYHYNSMQNCTFTKDAVGKSFKTYLQNV